MDVDADARLDRSTLSYLSVLQGVPRRGRWETPHSRSRGFRSCGGETDAKGLQVGRDPLGEQPDLAQVAHQTAMQVAAEILAEGRLVAAGRPLAPVALDLLEVGLAEAHF